jgi:hypothetical protein
VLVARGVARNLAAALTLDSDTTNADIQLEPGVAVTGRIVDSQGRGITNAQAWVALIAGHSGGQLGETAYADADGRYELKVLPLGRQLIFDASAKGFGRERASVDTSRASTNSSGALVLQLATIELLVADQRCAGEHRM